MEDESRSREMKKNVKTIVFLLYFPLTFYIEVFLLQACIGMMSQ
jgi:hypothetical protein